MLEARIFQIERLPTDYIICQPPLNTGIARF